MGLETVVPAPELTLALRDAFGLEAFVETGTLGGDTTRWAAGEFSQVYSIEASKQIWENVQPSFDGYNNIKSIFGGSGPELHKLVPTLPPTMFFLDAHWSGGITAGDKAECPLLTELALIMPWFQKHIILIDDARLFLKPPPPPHVISEWPSLDDIIRVTQGAAYTTVYRDMILLVPAFHRARVAAMLQSMEELG